MNSEEYKCSDITSTIIGCAMEVHRDMGSGFREIYYQRALAIEMKTRGLNFEREFPIDVFYKENLIGKIRADFFVEK